MKRRTLMEAIAGVALGAIAVGAIATGARGFAPQQDAHPAIPAVNAIGVPADSKAPGADSMSARKIKSIPVISWHQMDNSCEPTAALCATPEFAETNVTQRQFYDELSWAYGHGYRTVTAAQYVAWATDRKSVV